MPSLPMNPLGAFFISAGSGGSMYLFLRCLEGTVQGSAISGVIIMALTFGMLISKD